MVFLRTFFRGLVLLIALVSVALWVVAATLQATVFDRSTMKTWARDSGAYENIVDTIEIRQVDATGVVTSDMLRSAIGAVVTPDYLQKHTEIVVDAIYDWVEGDASEITYEIPIQEQRTEFVVKLGKLVEEKLQQLPACTGLISRSQQCIPRSYTLETYAASIAKQTAEDSDLFEKPITSEDIKLAQMLQQLPLFASLSQTAAWILPIVIVLGGGAYVALSQKWRLGIAKTWESVLYLVAFHW